MFFMSQMTDSKEGLIKILQQQTNTLVGRLNTIQGRMYANGRRSPVWKNAGMIEYDAPKPKKNSTSQNQIPQYTWWVQDELPRSK